MYRLSTPEIAASFKTLKILARALRVSRSSEAQGSLHRLQAGLPVYVQDADVDLLSSIGVLAEAATPPPPMPHSPSMQRLRDRLEGLVGPDGIPFGPPESSEDVRIAEARVGSLPADYKAWLGVGSGYDTGGPFGPWMLTSLCTALSTQAMREELHADQPDWWRPSWFEVAANGSGDSVCLDLESGRVIEFRHDDDARPRLADDFTGWLTAQIDRLESGERVVLERDGMFDGVMDRSELRGQNAALHVLGEPESTRQARIEQALRDPQVLGLMLFDRLRADGVLELKRGTFPMLEVLPALATGLAGADRGVSVAQALGACSDVVRPPTSDEVRAALEAVRQGR